MPACHPNAVRETSPPISHSCDHAVVFYEHDIDLMEGLGQHIGAALASQDLAIVIATRAHLRSLAEELRRRNLNAPAAFAAGRYLELDAADTLSNFIVGEGPDKQKFASTVGVLVRKAAAKLKPGRRLVVFGEMVALLWAEGKRDATLRLEELWNDLAKQYSFHLLCAYPVDAFNGAEHRQFFFNICGEHTHVNSVQSCPAHAGASRRRRREAGLPQKPRSLEAEICISQERVLLLQKTSRAGTWELDIETDTFSFSSAAARLLGLPFSSLVRLGQLMDLMYYSGDREAVLSHLQEAQRNRRDFKTAFRIRQGEETRIVEIQGKTFYNSGTPIMLGVLADATPELEAEPDPRPAIGSTESETPAAL